MKSTLSRAARPSRKATRIASSARAARRADVSGYEGVRVSGSENSSTLTPAYLHTLTPAPHRLVPARSGDHAAIHQLLLSIFHGPSAAEFHAQLDEPLYEPTDRLLVKSGEQLAAHLRITKRLLHFGSLTIPAAGFMDLGTSHEFRSRGFATALLDAGQHQAICEGALVGLTRTTAPELFRRQGWSVCGRHSFSVASPRQVLAHFCSRFPQDEPALADEEQAVSPLADRSEPPILVRPLRRIEMPAVMGIYEQRYGAAYGPLVRSDAWWDWLMARSAFDRAYVALAQGDHVELPQLLASVVGAAFVKEGRIVELLSLPGQERVARRLVARVCGDAVEFNSAQVRLDAAPHDPLHAHFAAAGGKTHLAATHQGETCMARVFDPVAMLRLLEGALLSRARAAELPRPFSLGLDVFYHDADLTHAQDADVRSYRLVIGQRGVKLTAGHPGRSYLSLRRRDLTPLLLGHWNIAEALAAGRLRASTRLAQDAAGILFPQLPWYRPPLDELVA
ncbi:MAG TPA: GNAT family N-acetyltransferase [Pirellulaceae bacterium]|nr:GNAT family N-acetyltransferase [Pirellulaceae bacterium]